ncbi:MAG: divalent metal cation transporter, partial [Alphaproteobacteria bacterium]|nr:divalent metal cation transporter [Alphaproteobacteria bacterium]
MEEKPTPKAKQSFLRRFFSALGPGVITGAADDDPSGIATYSIAGAQLGTSLLWMAFITWPLMGAVQMMCARIGMVTGVGLAGALRQKFPKAVLVIISVALLLANIINIGADLAGMADAAQILTGGNFHLFVVLFAVGISYATVYLRYYQIARILKWLALALAAYIITAFLVHPQWGKVLRDSFIPTMPKGKEGWETFVAIFGTTISPYLFFWQASQEVEEEKAMGRRLLVRRENATQREIVDRMIDVGTGTFFSNLVMFFIILTTALTLHAHGVTHIETSKEAAQALGPLAGEWAMMLYTIGIIGVGLLAIPTLSGSAAYAFAETFQWGHGLDQHFKQALEFYAVILLSTLCGVVMNFLHVNAIQALFWSAVINGALAPFLMLGIFLVARDNRIMKGQPSSRLNQVVVVVTILVMFG